MGRVEAAGGSEGRRFISRYVRFARYIADGSDVKCTDFGRRRAGAPAARGGGASEVFKGLDRRGAWGAWRQREAARVAVSSAVTSVSPVTSQMAPTSNAPILGGGGQVRSRREAVVFRSRLL